MRAPSLLLALVGAGCSGTNGVQVTVNASGSLPGITALAVTVMNAGMTTATPVPVMLSASPVDLSAVPQTFTLLFSSDRSGPVMISVVAKTANGATVATGSAMATIGQSEAVAITLPGGVPATGDMAVKPQAADGSFDGAADLSVPDLSNSDGPATPADLAVPADLSNSDGPAAPLDLATPPDLAIVVQCNNAGECARVDGGPKVVWGCCGGGYCSDTSSSAANCGGCGMATPPGWLCCNAVSANPLNDPDNCGKCGVSCPLTSQSLSTKCAGSACQVGACAMGFADCNHVYADGCEVTLATGAVGNGAAPVAAMVPNCGACGTNCTANVGPQVATVKCAAGACQVASCQMGYANCDGVYAHGCAANLGTSDGQQNANINHCGACGMVCPLTAQVTGTSCVAGACKITSCNPGYADCDGNFANGCEASLLTDAKNCKTCGNACGMNQVCTNGVCVMFVGSLSCAGLPATCGSNGNDNCCNSAVVPWDGGPFYRSYDKAGDGSSGNMMYPATLSDFRLDKYLITVGRFRKFVAAVQGGWVPKNGDGAHANIPNSGWNYDNAGWPAPANLAANVKCDATYQTYTDAVMGNETRPQNCMDWYEAFAFCAWDGGWLPTEAEYNYAAAGGSEQRAYPWSNPPGSTTIDCTYANYYGANGGNAFCYPNTYTTNVGFLSPKGDGKWGQSDLAGNLFEWNLDWDYSNYSNNANNCNNCAALQTTPSRVVRGGDFYYAASNLRSAYRNGNTPTNHGYGLGARCARTP